MKRSRPSLFLLISMIAILSVVLTACTGDDEDEPEDEAPVATATTGTETEPTEPAEDEAEPTEPTEDEADVTATPGDAGEGAVEGDAAAGEEIWQAQCMSCHTIDGSEGLGPTWQGLWMSEVPLEDGSTVTADETYITESIQDPNAKVHEGFQPIMPEFDLSDEEIANVIAFIQSLE